MFLNGAEAGVFRFLRRSVIRFPSVCISQHTNNSAALIPSGKPHNVGNAITSSMKRKRQLSALFDWKCVQLCRKNTAAMTDRTVHRLLPISTSTLTGSRERGGSLPSGLTPILRRIQIACHRGAFRTSGERQPCFWHQVRPAANCRRYLLAVRYTRGSDPRNASYPRTSQSLPHSPAGKPAIMWRIIATASV